MPRISPRNTVEVHGFAMKVIRQMRGRGVADLASKLPSPRQGREGCDRSYITHIENGTKTRVSAEFYAALLAELQIEDYRTLLANPHAAEEVSA